MTRRRVSYLRILGAEPQWALMTATADEDYGRTKVCTEQLRLVEPALLLGTELGTSPLVEKDWGGREYVQICSINQTPEQSDQELTSELNTVLGRFFEIYNSCTKLGSRANVEMIDLHDVLATDDLGSDVYFSDGVWLSNDGKLHNRGR